MITPLIIAGGIGSRFWPLSSNERPKQFLNLIDDDRNMIQLTVDRIKKIAEYEEIFIATSENYKKDVEKYLPEIPSENISIEPMRRNTAACIGLAALHIEKKYPEAIMVILPSDHLILDNDEFIKTIHTAVKIAETGGNLVTIGIEPTNPETGYGYINYNQNRYKAGFEVNKFTEKPAPKKAVEFIKSGNYLWNSGMFVWKVRTILKMFNKHMPELDQALENIREVIGTEEEKQVTYQEFEKLESISIDYGIMEKADNIYVVPGNFGWDDIGSWSSLEDVKDQDEDGNVVKGKHLSLKTNNSIIQAKDKLIATVGMDNVIIVESNNAILVCNKDNDQDVKELRNLIAEKGLDYLL
ncbi:MAG: mannose-1-phosphate guanylyltransferase [Halanaerobiales bacterium]